MSLVDHIYRMREYIFCGGVVMVPLLIISIVMWSIIIERLLFFKRLYRDDIDKRDAIAYLKQGKIPEVKHEGIIFIFVKRLIHRETGKKRIDIFLIDEVALYVSSFLDEYIPLIKIFAAIAPLLGLLGTVIGMIKTFDVIAIFGTGNAKAMASGISEALITTQTGLIIAIPGLYMSKFLERRSESLKQKIESISIFIKRHI